MEKLIKYKNAGKIFKPHSTTEINGEYVYIIKAYSKKLKIRPCNDEEIKRIDDEKEKEKQEKIRQDKIEKFKNEHEKEYNELVELRKQYKELNDKMDELEPSAFRGHSNSIQMLNLMALSFGLFIPKFQRKPLETMEDRWERDQDMKKYKELEEKRKELFKQIEVIEEKYL